MASFPALPSGNNPSIGAAAGYASSAASVLNALNAAAAQHADLLQKQKDKSATDYRTQLEKSFTNSRELTNENYVPTQTYANGDPLPGRPTLMTPEDNPAAAGGSAPITDTDGRQWTKKPALDDTNSFVAAPGSDTEKFLQETTNIKSGTRIPFTHLPAIDGLGTQMRQASETASKRKQVATVTQDASDKAKVLGMDLPVGSEVPIGQLKEVLDALQPKDKADSQVILPGKKGPKGGMLVYDKNTKKTEEVPYPEGSSDELNADQKDRSGDRKLGMERLAEDRAARLSLEGQGKSAAQQARENQAAKDHEAVGLKKQAMQGMAQGYYDAAQTEPGGNYFPPRYLNGIVTQGPPGVMPPKGPKYDALQKDLVTKAKGFEKTAASHQAEQLRIEKAHGWGDAGTTQTPPQQPTQPTVAQPAKAAPAAPKTASIANIRAYAAKNGIPEADAVRKAKAEGYSIGQ